MTKPVLLIRADGNQDDAQALTGLGIDSVIDPYIRIDRAPDVADAQHLLSQLSKPGNKWLIATSVNAIRCFAELVDPQVLRAAIAASVDLRFAAVGERTAQALRQIGADEVLTPELSDSAALATMLAELGQSDSSQGVPTAIIPSGLLAMKTLPNKLETTGWKLIQGVVYTTITVEAEPATAAAARANEFGAVIFRSPSAARAFLSFVPNPQMPLIAAGFTTAKVIQDAGLAVASIPSNPTPKSVAAAVSEILKGDR
jgi:uroporphyrinogen-III synthase